MHSSLNNNSNKLYSRQDQCQLMPMITKCNISSTRQTLIQFSQMLDKSKLLSKIDKLKWSNQVFGWRNGLTTQASMAWVIFSIIYQQVSSSMTQLKYWWIPRESTFNIMKEKPSTHLRSKMWWLHIYLLTILRNCKRKLHYFSISDHILKIHNKLLEVANNKIQICKMILKNLYYHKMYM